MPKLSSEVGTMLTTVSAILALGLAPAALADKPEDKPTPPAMKVHVDKETGKLRRATAAEAEAMEDATQRQLAADWWDATVPGSDADGEIELANGGKMMRMSVDSLEAFAIKIDEDGKAVAMHADADGEKLEDEKEVTRDDR
jgi:hypothetical protein